MTSESIPDYAKVEVYWNFHKKLFSVRLMGRVVAHVKRAVLSDVTYRVSEAGRQRVLRQKRKNVHAVLRGLWCPERLRPEFERTLIDVAPITYNPYKVRSFVDDAGVRVDWSRHVKLDADAPVKITDCVVSLL